MTLGPTPPGWVPIGPDRFNLPFETFVESGIYEIRPIPEPGTWLLVPTAVGLAWLARKKRKARKSMRANAQRKIPR